LSSSMSSSLSFSMPSSLSFSLPTSTKPVRRLRMT
jgi:hypothetical protein